MVQMLTLQASASESLASQLNVMTWSKVHTSTVVTASSAATIEETNQYDRWVEIFSWLSARGWTITEAAGNLAGNQYNYWRLEKTVTSYEGIFQTYFWNFRLTNTTSSSTAAWFNGRNSALEFVTSTTASIETLANPWPDSTADAVEMWQSDQDNDSYLLISRYSGGASIARGFMPGSNSLRANATSSAELEGCFKRVVYPIFRNDQLRSNSTDLEMGFGEINHTNSLHTNVTPVITHGELTIHDRSEAYYKWRQADVSTLETPANSEDGWDPISSANTNTRVIDGTYYIQLGIPSSYAVALLDCGAVNPNFNA